VHFDSFHKEIKIEDLFSNAFRDYPELKETYDDVLIIHNNNLSTLFPLRSLMRISWELSAIQYQGFETDFFAHDEISNYQINSVYIPYVNMNNFY
jgi:hypothetical protein